MKRLLFILYFQSTIAFASSGYYEQEQPPVNSPAQPSSQSAKPISTPTNIRRHVVTEDGGAALRFSADNEGGQKMPGGASSEVRADGQVALPPNMERGVRELEVGVEEVGAYTGEMGAHLQKNGLRGFLAVPPELQEKGRAIGRRVGSGVGAIMQDVGQEMVAPPR